MCMLLQNNLDPWTLATILNEAADKSTVSVIIGSIGTAFQACKQKLQIKPLKLPFVTCLDLTLR